MPCLQLGLELAAQGLHQTNTWGTGIPKPNFGVSTSTNRLTPPTGYTMTFDSAGNLTTDTYTGAGSRTYDGENRMIAAQGINQGNWQYYNYNAEGQRVRRNVEGVETWQIYGMDGELLAEYAMNGAVTSPQKEYGYRKGQLLVTAEAPANVALSANGAVATTSSTYNASYPASATINGDRKGLNWNNGGGWNDGTASAYPDWLQIDFNGSKTINEINVVTLQDNPASPGEPTETMTFASYGITAFDVQYWDGSNWVTVPGGSVTGNDKVWRKFSFSPIMTSKVRVMVNNALASYSRIIEVEAWGMTTAAATNVALSTNGAGGTASSTYNSNYPASSTINGDRKGVNWNSGGGWNDSTASAYPDWLQVDFNGSKTINEINVFTLQDNPASPVEPTETMTFASYGITAFDVQYWNGSSWVTVTGGSITGNNKVWRKLSFSPLTTTKIRVLTNASVDGYSRITEVEAWGYSSGLANINWLVTDQLGTPRITLDKTGSLAAVKRHDYLPFGEELYATQGGRTAGLGYSTDSVRQKFTSKERDNETGLDYFLARYYSSTQGRFSSSDPIMMMQDRLYDPQRINLYAYCRNNPLAFIDPTGEKISYKNEESEKAYKDYVAYLEKCGKKCEGELATVLQLKDSDVNYVIELGGKPVSETAEGNTAPDAKGENIMVRITNVGGPHGETYDRNGRFAHELEHARQFDSGELAFARSQDGTWYPLQYDIYDEVNSFNAQLQVSPPIKDSTLLRSLRDDRLNDDDRANRLKGRPYPKLPKTRSNVDAAWGAKPGELVRPAANRPFFGRVRQPSK